MTAGDSRQSHCIWKRFRSSNEF